MKVFEQICNILTGQCADLAREPQTDKKPGEIVLGSITDPTARFFYAFWYEFASQAHATVTGHALKHEKGLVHDESECRASHEKHRSLVKSSDLCRDLFREHVSRQFPADSDDFAIRKGWRVVLPSDSRPRFQMPWSKAKPLFLSGEHPCNTFLADVLGAVTAKEASAEALQKVSLPPYDADVDVKVIGVVTDPRVRMVRVIQDKLTEATRTIFPAFADKAEFDRWLSRFSGSEMVLIERRIKRVQEQSSMANRLFWAGVRETVPMAGDYPHLGIRDGWSVTEMKIPSIDIVIPLGLLKMLGIVPPEARE